MPARFLVKLTASAESDIDDIWSFIAHDSPPNADRFLEELDKQVATLERFPERCPLIPENTLMGTAYRHLMYGEYRTIFRVSGRTVHVVRIVHGTRLLDTSLFESGG